MKYVNQLNFVLAAIGVAIVIYTLSGTLLDSATRVSPRIELPAPVTPKGANRPLQGPGNNRARPAALPQPDTSQTAEPLANSVPGDSIGRSSVTASRPAPNRSGTSTPGFTVGQSSRGVSGSPRGDTSLAPNATPPRTSPTPQDRTYSSGSPQPNNDLEIVPPRVEGATKKDGSEDPAPPSTRSSMPEQRPPQ